MADFQFTRWLIDLDAKIKSVQNSFSLRSVSELERLINACEAQLSLMYNYARQHNIDLYPFYKQLIEIEANLKTLKYQVEQKKERVQIHERSFWQKLWRGVVVIVEFAANLIGLGSTVRALMGGDKNRELPPGY